MQVFMPFAVQDVRAKKISVNNLFNYLLPVQHVKATHETFSNNIW